MKIKKLLNLFAVSLLIIPGLSAMTTDEQLKQLYVFVVNNNADESIGLSLLDWNGNDLYDVVNKAKDESVIITLDPEEDRNIQFPLKLFIYPSDLGVAKKIDIKWKGELSGDKYGSQLGLNRGYLISGLKHRLVFTVKKIDEVPGDRVGAYLSWKKRVIIEIENLEKQTKDLYTIQFDSDKRTFSPSYQRGQVPVAEPIFPRY